MNGKGLGTLIIAILAVLGGAFAATMLIRKKLAKNEDDADFDAFENPVDDEEFEHFFGDDEDEVAEVPEEAEETEDEEAEEQL